MLILTVRTDKPEAEVGLYEDNKRLAYIFWLAHRQLAETIHIKLKELLESQKKSLNDIGGVVVFKGPGSFTGLRIGISVVNALAYGLNVPVVATEGDEWLDNGIKRLMSGKSDTMAIPEYGAPARTTTQKR